MALQVALVERFDESLALLEKVLPSVFKGVVQLYAKQGSSRVNTQRTNTQVAQASPSLGSDGSSSSSSSSGGSSGGGFSAAQAPGVRGGRSLHTLPLSLSFSFPNTVLPTETTKGSARHNATAKAYLSLPPDVEFFLFNKLKHEVGGSFKSLRSSKFSDKQKGAREKNKKIRSDHVESILFVWMWMFLLVLVSNRLIFHFFAFSSLSLTHTHTLSFALSIWF